MASRPAPAALQGHDIILDRPAQSASPRAVFRPDIEGLRALAVVPIVLNHASVRGVLGGFIGVDIFFVISGYLITGILLRDVATGKFSIAHFYRRRVLRIFPALFLLLGVTSAVAIAALTPGELVSYARSLAATVLFASNFYFWAHTGYFAQAAETVPLLHTWSLAVEEQFYIFWPLLIVLLAARSRRALELGLVAVTAASLVIAIWLVATDMTPAFYLIPSRAWEFGVGALAVLWPLERVPRWFRQVLGIAGCLTLIYCINAYRPPLAFPGLAAVAPCLATVALILAGPQSLAGRALALAPVRFVGRISYSLYLWHWPVIVFTSLYLFLPQTPLVITAQVLLSMLLATSSYYLVETRGRSLLAKIATPRLLIGAAGAMAGVAALALAVAATGGFAGRYPPDRLRVASILDRDEQAGYRSGSCFVLNPGDRFDAATCLHEHGDKPAILLIGDSMAAHFWPGLAMHGERYDILQATSIGCPPGLYEGQTKMPCQRFFHDLVTGWIPQHKPEAVLLAGYWNSPDAVAEADRLLASFRSIGQPVIMIGPMPDYATALPRLIFFGGDTRAQAALKPNVFAYDAQLAASAARNHAAYISPLAFLCPARHCRTLTRDGLPLQFDEHHLTREGSQEVVAMMMPAIDRAMHAAAAR